MNVHRRHKEDETGKDSVQTRSSRARLRMKRFSVCRAQVYKHARSTSSTSRCFYFILIITLLTNIWITSEQEHDRTTESSNVDDRIEHELYAHPFLRSVMAGVASVMCSYSKSLCPFPTIIYCKLTCYCLM